MTEDRRLIEDYLPTEAISGQVSGQRSVREGPVSMLDLRGVRRLLVACRARGRNEVAAGRHFDIPAEAVGRAGRKGNG